MAAKPQQVRCLLIGQSVIIFIKASALFAKAFAEDLFQLQARIKAGQCDSLEEFTIFNVYEAIVTYGIYEKTRNAAKP